MGKKKLGGSRKQRIRERNEALHRKWSTEEHRKKIEKTQNYLRSIGSTVIESMRPSKISSPKQPYKHSQHKKVKHKKIKNKNAPRIVIPKQYLAQQNKEDKHVNNSNKQNDTNRSIIKESVVANTFIRNTSTRITNKRRGSARKKSRENYKYPETDNKDYYDFAGEYEARNIEYGHGRKKSKEWNDQAALGLRDELAELKRLREEGWID